MFLFDNWNQIMIGLNFSICWLHTCFHVSENYIGFKNTQNRRHQFYIKLKKKFIIVPMTGSQLWKKKKKFQIYFFNYKMNPLGNWIKIKMKGNYRNKE